MDRSERLVRRLPPQGTAVTCATCARARINTHNNLHCTVLGRPVPLSSTCSAHSDRSRTMQIICAWCGLHLGGPTDGETTHGMCESCRSDQIAKARAALANNKPVK